MGTRLEQERCFPPPVPDLHSLLEQGNVFFVGHVTPLTAGMGFILTGSKTPINVCLGSCPKTTPFSCYCPCPIVCCGVSRRNTERNTPPDQPSHGRRACSRLV